MTSVHDPETFAATWSTAVGRSADSTFLIFHDDDATTTQWSYEQFDQVVSRVAAALAAAGVGRGDAVHVALRNCPAFVATWLAVARMGAWFVPVDPSSSPRDLARQIDRIGAVLGLCGAARSQLYREAAPDGMRIIELAEDSSDVSDDSPLLPDAAWDGPAGVSGSDRLAVMFTSGTTSEPKGVVLTQRNYAHVAAVMASLSTTTSDSRWYVTLPMFHANAQYYCFAAAIAAGASVGLTKSFSASRWAAIGHELSVTHASLFAAPIRMILARTPQPAPAMELKHLWYAQSLGEAHYDAFIDLAGCRPRQLYGMTETVAVVTIDHSQPLVHDVIGMPACGRAVQIDGVPLVRCEAGAVGVLSVTGTPGADLFEGYLHDADTTGRAFTREPDGKVRFNTGDVVLVGDDGQLKFVGRVDDVIKVSGENVSLSETEAVIAQAPGVLEAAVVARSDPVRDQVPVAYVVAADASTTLDLDELAQWATRNVTAAARPREWHQIAELPRTSVGKVRRFEIDS